MDVVRTELCEYLQVRHSKVDPASAPQDSPSSSTSSSPTGSSQNTAPLPSKFYKHWTTLWSVLKMEITPNQSYIGYCKKESDWLADSQTIAKCYLGETFKVERPAPGYSKKYSNVVQLVFKGYRLDLAFDSMTKLEQWHKALQVLSDRHHVDLVRCPEHPDLEGEYVVQVCANSYLVWAPGATHGPPKPKWEWQLKHIRRVHWHKNVSKLEVEPGRSSGTGEGHFYFTGQHSYRLFRSMKHMMASHSSSSSSSAVSPSSSTKSSSQGAFSRRAGSEGGAEASSGGESDWTGTGDDWTGASSDSAFINYIRSQHQNSDRFKSPGVSPSPPPPQMTRGGSRPDEMVYMSINQQTLNEDNQYCTIHDLHKKPASPSPNKRPPLPLQPVVELTDSAEDEYCKMVPNSVRTELKQRSVENPAHLTYNYPTIPPPSNLHQTHSYSPSHLIHNHHAPPPAHAHRVSPAAQ